MSGWYYVEVKEEHKRGYWVQADTEAAALKLCDPNTSLRAGRFADIRETGRIAEGPFTREEMKEQSNVEI